MVIGMKYGQDSVHYGHTLVVSTFSHHNGKALKLSTKRISPLGRCTSVHLGRSSIVKGSCKLP